jgi:hypothetical protein
MPEIAIRTGRSARIHPRRNDAQRKLRTGLKLNELLLTKH